MKLGSLFDGSGGFPLAGSLCGITPAWAAEVEPYPIAVTTSRFPNMKHLGSVTDINGAEIEPVDIITFGSPCQDLSVAGKRAGLKHEANGDEETTRSGLFMEAVRIIKEMRRATNGVYPTFAIWENVPGAFSSNSGNDFRVVIEELIKIVEPDATVPAPDKGKWPYADAYVGDGWSLAYRTLDAQYWGVPQRRRRIYLVVDFRGERAQKVLFKSDGLHGYFEEGRTPWKGTAGNAGNRPGADDRDGAVGIDGYNSTTTGDNQMAVAYGVTTKGNGDAFISEERHTAISVGGGQAGQGYPCAMVPTPPICMATQQVGAVVDQHILDDQGGSQIGVRTDGKAPTLRAEMHGNVPCVMDAVGFDMYNQQVTGNVSRTVKTPIGGDDLPVACYSIENHPADSRVDIDDSGKVQTLTSRMGTGGGNVPMVMEPKPVVYDGSNVTSPINASNPQPGDPCHTLSTDSRNILVEPVYCLQGNGIDRADTAGCNGKGVKEDICYTLNTIDRPTVAYSLETFHCTSKEDKTTTLKARDWKDPVCVAYAAYGFDQGATRDVGKLFLEEQSKTLTNGTCPGHHNGVVVAENPVAIDRAAFNQGQNAQYAPQFLTDGTNPTLVARGPSAVAHKQEIRYIVRRLTPTECARLQGFPDKWGHITHKEDFTDEEYHFWLKVRNTHAAINGKTTKEYTKQQMLTWYNKLHTDSSEYKMWGNGIALPTALLPIRGIADELERGRCD